MAKFLTALILVAVVAVAIATIDSRSAGLAEAPRPDSAGLQLPDRIYALGIVEGATEDIELRPEQVGRVTEVLVAAGDWVEAGQVLVRLDDARQRQHVALADANLELAEAELERLTNGARADEREEAHALYRAAQARLQQASQTWVRIEQLRSERAVSQQEADDQRTLVDALRAELEAAEARVRQIEAPARADELRAATARVAAVQAELDLAKIGLSKSELRAPRRACVLDVNIEPGELTGPDAPQPLVVLSDTSSIRVRAFVEELDAPRVTVGMPASVTADGIPDTNFTGRVVSISPQMQPKSIHADRPNELYDTKVREVLVEMEPGSEQLIVGLRVDVSFAVADAAPTETDAPLSASAPWQSSY